MTITDVDPTAPLNEVITSMTLTNEETRKVNILKNFIKLALRITLVGKGNVERGTDLNAKRNPRTPTMLELKHHQTLSCLISGCNIHDM